MVRISDFKCIQVIYTRHLTSPDAHDAIATALDHVAVLDADVFDDSRRLVLLCLRDARAALPLPRFHLIVYLDHVVSSRADDAPAVEHHAGDPVVVRIGIENGTRSKIPYLEEGSLLARRC